MLRQFLEGPITRYMSSLRRLHQCSADVLTEGPALTYHRLGRVQARRLTRSF
jgi:hypothetical protein